MLQKLHNGFAVHAVGTPTLFLLVAALVSITFTSEGRTLHVDSQEIQAADCYSVLTLHNRRDNNPDHFSKVFTGLPVSTTLAHDPGIFRRSTLQHAHTSSPSFSVLTITIVSASFL